MPHLFTAFVFVENPVVPPGVFVSLFRVISMTLSVSQRLNFPALLNCVAKFPATNSWHISGKSSFRQIPSVVNIIACKNKWDDFTNAT